MKRKELDREEQEFNKRYKMCVENDENKNNEEVKVGSKDVGVISSKIAEECEIDEDSKLMEELLVNSGPILPNESFKVMEVREEERETELTLEHLAQTPTDNIYISNSLGTYYTLILRNGWRACQYRAGDIITVLGSFDSLTRSSIFDDLADSPSSIYDQLLILLPQLLLTPTAISDSISCLRKAVIAYIYKSSANSPFYPFLIGSLTHELFQTLLVRDQGDIHSVNYTQLIRSLLNQHLLEIYLLEKEYKEVESDVANYLENILNWVSNIQQGNIYIYIYKYIYIYTQKLYRVI